MKKKVIINIIELVLWAIMLYICYLYISLNSAEKINFLSGMDVFKQKVVMWVGNLVGKWNSSQAEVQQSMIRTYKEILSFAKEKNCNTSFSMLQVETFITEISGLSPIEYAQKEAYYTNHAAQLYNELKKCTKGNK